MALHLHNRLLRTTAHLKKDLLASQDTYLIPQHPPLITAKHRILCAQALWPGQYPYLVNRIILTPQ